MRTLPLCIIGLSCVVFSRPATFKSADTILMQQQGVSIFVQKDLDSDGDIDWVTLGHSTGSIAIVTNNRHGSFTSVTRGVSVMEPSAIDCGDACPGERDA